MQSLRFTLLLIGALLIGAPTADAVVAVKSATETEATVAVEKRQLSKKELRKERRMQRKAVRKQIKEAIKEWRREKASDNTLLLVIVAILLPPLAMLIYEGGLTSRFWLSLLLTLLFYLPGLIYTLVIILGGR